MNCPACDLADKGELTGLYHTGCESCTARHIANGIDLFNAIQAGGKTPEYDETIRKIWGDRWEAGHKLVKRWHKKLKGKK